MNLAHLLQHVPVLDDAKACVVARLQEPHRRYHTVDHVVEMWRWHCEHNNDRFSDMVVASFCLYHDAIYDPAAVDGANEQASCDLWLEDSVQLADQDSRNLIDQIIFASSDHFHYREDMWSDEWMQACWCLDLDLLRLGSPYEVFTAHGRDIRTEYAHLTDQQWLKASSEFRAKVMAEPKIFYHGDFQQSEMQARSNLSRALVQDWHQLGYIRYDDVV
jgi:predicted metal-dependent HD superfamily phosphohydrolase